MTHRIHDKMGYPFIMIQSKVAQAAGMIRERLRNGTWQNRLPAERELASELLISRSTLRAACTILMEEGWLKPCKHTRAGREIRLPKQPQPTNAAQGSVHILTPSLADNTIFLEHLATIRGELAKADATVHVHEIPHITKQASPERALGKLFKSYPNAVWVLHKMPQTVQRAADHIGAPAMVFGSVFPDINLPSIDLDFAATARHAANRCIRAGRKRIGLILHRTQLAGDTLAAEAVTEITVSKNLPKPILIRHDFNRNTLINSLDARLANPKEFPDALIIINQHHLLTALPHLLQRQRKIPQETSMIYLGNDPVVERLSPVPDRYDVGNALSRGLVRMCISLLSGERPKSRRLFPKTIRGETLPIHPPTTRRTQK